MAGKRKFSPGDRCQTYYMRYWPDMYRNGVIIEYLGESIGPGWYRIQYEIYNRQLGQWVLATQSMHARNMTKLSFLKIEND